MLKIKYLIIFILFLLNYQIILIIWFLQEYRMVKRIQASMDGDLTIISTTSKKISLKKSTDLNLAPSAGFCTSAETNFDDLLNYTTHLNANQIYVKKWIQVQRKILNKNSEFLEEI